VLFPEFFHSPSFAGLPHSVENQGFPAAVAFPFQQVFNDFSPHETILTSNYQNVKEKGAKTTPFFHKKSVINTPFYREKGAHITPFSQDKSLNNAPLFQRKSMNHTLSSWKRSVIATSFSIEKSANGTPFS
jgi:hypothetical protein